MSFILSLETSTSVCSVALHDSGKLVVDREVHIPQSHASKLAVMIDEIRNLSGIDLKELDAVAIASGPGSYTGLRIGTSTAKALCYSLNVPLIAIGTLDIMISQVRKSFHEDVFFCPMIDARRMEVYCQIVDTDLLVKQPVQAKVIDESSFSEFLMDKKVVFFGDGAAKCKDLIHNEKAIFLDNIFPAASELGILANQKLLNHQVEDVVHFEPFYLKDFLVRKPA